MARLITTGEIMRMIDEDERFVLVNVLKNSDYEEEHICGSINIPLEDIEKQAPEVLGDMEEKIIAYCAGPECTASEEAAEKLTALGYKEILRYKGGMEEWTTEGHCTEGAAIDRQRKAVS